MGKSPQPKIERNQSLYMEWKAVDTEGKRVQTVDQIIKTYNAHNPNETIGRRRFYMIMRKIDKDYRLRRDLIAQANPHLTQDQTQQMGL